MGDHKYTITDVHGKTVPVLVRQDRRLKKSSRWQWEKDGSILLRIPYHLPKREVGRLLDQVAGQLSQQKKLAERRTDAELQLRAEMINRKYFGGKIEWRAIRWVGNMEQRLGSCTNGGPTDGHIRISEKIRDWPDWVVDYIIAHELVHRLHANHGLEFWKTLTQAYPLSERARGFVKGVGFVEGKVFEEE